MPEEKATVLVVDDTPENIELMVNILSEDYKVKAAISGQKAMQIARSSPPDIILLDVMMPGIDGYQVCEFLKADVTTRHIPILFVTAKIGLLDELRGFELGAADYIAKPISPPVVKARVKTQLALYNQNRELERKVRERTAELHETRLQIIQRLGRAAEYKDDETGMHVIRMSHYAKVLGLAAGMSEAEAETLFNAAPMHDIGKIGIPDEILKKPGKLDAQEFEIMQGHCEIGAAIIGDDSSDLLQMARIIALSHHERWDGSGYPHGLAGEDIPRVGRIVAIADVFDALTSRRPYKDRWSVEDTVALIDASAGSQFDPHLVHLMKLVLPQFLDIKTAYGN